MSNLKFQKASLGIRHARSFRIPEIIGEITDKITSDANSPFYRDIYTSTRPLIDIDGDLKGRILVSEKIEHSLTIDTDNVIITVSEDDTDTAISTIKNKYFDYISKEIFSRNAIVNINRIGVIFEYKLEDTKTIPNNIVNTVTNGIYKEVEGFNLKFSEKLLDPLSFTNKDYYDYQNHIISIDKTEKDLFIRYDFQIYCRPEVERLTDLDVKSFLDSGKSLITSKLVEALKSYGLS